MLKKTSLWAAIAAVALVGLSLGGGSVAFADPPCPPADRPCPPGKDGTPPAGAAGQGVQNEQGAGEGRHGAFGVVDNKDSESFDLLTKQGKIEVTYDGSTKCKVPGPGGSDECTDVVVNGNYVSVQGTPEDGGIAANKIQLNRGRSLHEHCVGEVQSFSGTLADGTLTVACRTDGGPDDVFVRTFHVDASTKLSKDIDEPSDLTGEVMVVGMRSLGETTYDAKVVHKVAD